jgi:hypothetical protein
VSNVNHVSSNAYISSGQCSSSSIIYNACSIKTFLKEQPGKYVLVENHKVNHVEPSPCSNRFALPAVKDENNRSIIIKNFASCRSCHTTYAYTCVSKNYHQRHPLHHQGTVDGIFFFTYFIYISSSKSRSLTSKNNRLLKLLNKNSLGAWGRGGDRRKI